MLKTLALIDDEVPGHVPRNFADELDNAQLVTYEGTGHTAYLEGSSCVDDAVDQAPLERLRGGKLASEQGELGGTGGGKARPVSLVTADEIADVVVTVPEAGVSLVLEPAASTYCYRGRLTPLGQGVEWFVPGRDYRAALLGSSPSAYWRLGETGGSTAADASGSGSALTYQNGVALGRDIAPNIAPSRS